ncbi:alpha/beta fold hydrolase [Parasegetibacter sp. NRK P23]|uniref:alpha/beta fold hydrolase n=1 Tax=Parasegetibacter sp. NRK P23 TaxID=2942999 RepID=UPI0020444F1B|nr:alpha/beta hydrolase [Parasegetibacter sp. NRK P23]MCM5530491.1 alpha/beta hydrolase [Parasegetibacter sp. NRK P23]
MRQIILLPRTMLPAYILCLLAFAGCKNDNTKNTLMSDKPSITAVNAPTQFADINGRKIAYRTVGSGAPMILCQRFRGNMDDWDPAFIDALAKNYEVIIFNYTGLASSTGEPHTDMKTFSSDVIDLAKALGHQKVILGGWSFGGWVAQIVTTENPELVAQTILIGTKPPGENKHTFEDIFLQTAYKPDYDVADEVILFFEPISAFSRKAAQESHDRIAARKEKDPRVTVDQFKFYAMGNEDFIKDPYNARQKLTTTTIPILVISGDHEVCFPPENWFELNRKLPTTQVVVIPRAGHGPQHQYPEMTADYIHSFIQTNNRLAAAQ